MDSCASLWSAKLCSIRAWLWVLPSGSRGLKLKRKETLSWSSPVRGTRPHSPRIDHTCHHGRIPSPGRTPLCWHCLLMVRKTRSGAIDSGESLCELLLVRGDRVTDETSACSGRSDLLCAQGLAHLAENVPRGSEQAVFGLSVHGC